jgi:peptidoglycan/xylan/chitin deacetylase (PgdA/CDA1 family)
MKTLICTSLLALLLIGCGGGPSTVAASKPAKPAPTPPEPTTPAPTTPAPSVLTTINLSPATASITVGGVQAYVAQGLDQNQNPMTGITFTWTSLDDSVNGNGNAIAMFQGGTATGMSPGTMHVTASASGVTSAPAALTVVQPASVLTSIAVTPTTGTVQAGNTLQLTVVALDQYNNPMTGLTFVWTSAKPGVATVNAIKGEGLNIGVATGVAPGTVAITASVNGVVSPPTQLTVTPAPPVLTTINISPTNASIIVGGAQTFTATGSDQFGSAIALPAITWTSAAGATMNGAVATAVTAGSVQITATAGAITGNVFLTVTTPPPPPPAAPIVSRLSPPIALTGSAALTDLTITGSNFATGATVNFGANVLTPVTISATSITVTVPATELQTSSTQLVSVANNPGAVTSNTLPFTITNNGFVSIDFDDGYQSMYDIGLPIFDAAGIRTTQYIITGGFQPVNNGAGCGCTVGVGAAGFVTWDEVHTMANNGHEIGAHTRTHQPSSLLTAAERTAEFTGSKQDLIAQGFNPLTFAYPYGDYGYPKGTIGKAVKAAGFLGARDSDLGYVGASLGANYAYPFYLWSEAGENDMNTTLADLTGFIDYAVANKLWVIILLHRVDDMDPGDTDISISSVILQGMVDHIVANQVNVVTNSEGLVIENLNGQTQTFVFP